MDPTEPARRRRCAFSPTSGSVFIDGLSVRDDPRAARLKIGLVPEDAGDYKNLTLAEELEYHGAMFGLDANTIRQRSDGLIRRLDLQNRVNDRLHTFSRGMRRKCHLIRALLHQPRLLLLDEPTAGLDPSIVEEVWDLLKALTVENHVTVILCSHHLEEVERLCSRVAILKRRLLVEGTLAELSGGDRHYRMELIGDASALAESARAVHGVRSATAEGSTLHFELDGAAEQIVPEVVRTVVAGGGKMLSLKRQDRDLRSLYRGAVEGESPKINGASHV
jgi:ABC-2 type transport system ATP-binding protein